jgi:hypothetical protein
VNGRDGPGEEVRDDGEDEREGRTEDLRSVNGAPGAVVHEREEVRDDGEDQREGRPEDDGRPLTAR